MLSHPCIRSYCVLTIVYWYVSGHKEINHRQWLAVGGELELDAGVPLGAGGVLPVTLGVQQQDGLPTLHQVLSSFGKQPVSCVTHLLGWLARVEVEVDKAGQQRGGEEEQ